MSPDQRYLSRAFSSQQLLQRWSGRRSARGGDAHRRQRRRLPGGRDRGHRRPPALRLHAEPRGILPPGGHLPRGAAAGKPLLSAGQTAGEPSTGSATTHAGLLFDGDAARQLTNSCRQGWITPPPCNNCTSLLVQMTPCATAGSGNSGWTQSSSRRDPSSQLGRRRRPVFDGGSCPGVFSSAPASASRGQVSLQLLRNAPRALLSHAQHHMRRFGPDFCSWRHVSAGRSCGKPSRRRSFARTA